MRGVFLSYRRSDAQADAGRLNADLERIFGDDRVFKDVADVPLGSDIGSHIDDAIDGSFMVLALVGPDWEPERLSAEDDWVRLELEAAREASITILPVRLRRAELPPLSDLPESLRWFSGLNAAELEHPSWHRDLAPILDRIRTEADRRGIDLDEAGTTTGPEPDTGPGRPIPFKAGAVAAVAAAVVVVLGLLALTGQFDDAENQTDDDLAAPEAIEPVAIRIVSGPNLNVVRSRSFQFNYATNQVCGTGSFVVERVSDGVAVGEFEGEDVCFGPLHGGFPGLPNNPDFEDFDLEPDTDYRVLITVRGTAADNPGEIPGLGTAEATLDVTTAAG